MQLTSILRERYKARDDAPEDSVNPGLLGWEEKTRRWKSGAVVLVIGAGASLESGRRTWDDPRLRAALIETVGPGFGGTGSFVREASYRLARHLPHVIGPNQNPRLRLETHARTDHLCEVACRLARGRHLLIEFLRREYGPSAEHVPPQLAYELIAHLVKHRFVDHLISLNFDETLDASLDDELGENGYRKVLPGLSTSRAQMDLPHLFKVHGTISDADSLRFDTDATGVLSASMLRLLDRVVFGPVARQRSVWVISLGYSWADPDLRAWLARKARWLAGVVCVALDRKPTDLLREELRKGQAAVGSSAPPATGSAGTASLVDIYPVATEEVVADGNPATVDEVLWAVWNDVKRNTPHPDQDRVPSAARHLLLSHLFRNREGTLRQWPAVYDRHSQAARFEAEVFLTTGKTDGLVILSSLARDSRVIRHWSPGLGRGLPVIDRLGFLARNPYADVTEVYFFRDTAKEYARYFTRRVGEWFPLSKQHVPDLWKERIDVPLLRDGVIHRRRVRYIRFLHKYFRKVFFGPSVEVDPGLDPRAALLFRQPRSVPTYKALRDHTADLMNSDWTVLLVIAESGEWLTHFASLFTPPQQRTVLLIEASSFSLQAWTARRIIDLSRMNTPTIGIPWWVHNRHLTLAMGGDGSLLGGLYFRRRQRTPRVSPISLDDRRDLGELLKMFFSYAARFYEEWGSTITPDDAARYAPAEFYQRLINVSRGNTLGNQGAMWTHRLESAWTRYQTHVPAQSAGARVPAVHLSPAAAVEG